MPDVVILVMAFGTPGADPQSAAHFLSQVSGHTPTPEQVDDLLRRVAAIGGSPIVEITRRQAGALERELARRHGPGGLAVAMAMRHGDPAPETVLSSLPDGGRLVILPLSPQDSADRRRYRERVDAAATTLGRTWDMDEIPAFGIDARFAALLAGRLRSTLETVPPSAPVVFTAHSLPRALPGSYEYCDAVAATAQHVAQTCGLPDERWSAAFQSVPPAARQPWLEPNLNDVVADLATHAPAVVVAPVQFVTDHMEILYDIDVTARGIAAAHGCRLARPAALNAGADFITFCADLVDEHLGLRDTTAAPTLAAPAGRRA